MYLSKKDYDFLLYMHDHILLDTVENREQFIPQTVKDFEIPVSLAALFTAEEYSYFVDMLLRLKRQRDDYNEKQRVKMQEMRILHGKNYGRGYTVTVKKNHAKEVK